MVGQNKISPFCSMSVKSNSRRVTIHLSMGLIDEIYQGLMVNEEAKMASDQEMSKLFYSIDDDEDLLLVARRAW